MLVKGARIKCANVFSTSFILFLEFMLLSMKNINKINMDIAYNFQFGFQDPGSLVMESIINFHHDIMFFLILIVVKIITLLFIISNFKENINHFFERTYLKYFKEKDKKFVFFF